VAVFSGTPGVQPVLYGGQSVLGIEFQTAGWSIGGTATLSVGADGIDSAGGANAVAPPVTMTAASTWTVGPGSTLSVGGEVQGGGFALTKDGGGTLQMSSARNLGGLNIDAGTLATPRSGSQRTLVTQSFTLAESGGVPTATLDLADNALVIDYSGDPASSPLEQIKGWIQAGWLDPDVQWYGPGITSTAARDNPGLYTIGFVDQGRLLMDTGELWYGDGGTRGPTFGGVEVDWTSILVRFTYLGDIDLDGKVYDDDVGIMSGNYTTGGPTGAQYWTGDIFGFDGWVYDDEAGIIGGAYNNGRLYGDPLGSVGGLPLAGTQSPEDEYGSPGVSRRQALSAAAGARSGRAGISSTALGDDAGGANSDFSTILKGWWQGLRAEGLPRESGDSPDGSDGVSVLDMVKPRRLRLRHHAQAFQTAVSDATLQPRSQIVVKAAKSFHPATCP